jgi:transposase
MTLRTSASDQESLNHIKYCGRIATRYEKLAANYLSFVKLASIRLWLRDNESASWIKILVA